MSIRILKPGLLATVQDLGRFGLQKVGVPVGGAMDAGAARAANLLVGNDEGEAVLELTLGGTELLLEEDGLLAVCGADVEAEADGVPLPFWRPVLVRKDVKIKFGVCRSGCRSYVAIWGGLDVPERLGSRSTYLRGGFGGHEGRALKAGDTLRAKAARKLSVSLRESLPAIPFGRGFAAASWHAAHFAVASHPEETVIRAMPGAHFPLLTEESQSELFGGTFRIGIQSDRMGCRLESTHKLQLRQPLELLSEAVAAGTVQLPPDGNPIVLLADRQTTGGYPRIAHVASVDIPVFAQLKPGDRFRFEAVTQREAERLYFASERDLRLLKAAVLLKGRT